MLAVTSISPAATADRIRVLEIGAPSLDTSSQPKAAKPKLSPIARSSDRSPSRSRPKTKPEPT